MSYSEEVTDEELIYRYKEKNEEEAFVVLIRKYTPIIYRFAFSLVKNQTDAEDVTQLTFIKVWDKIDSYKKGQSFKSWIYKIAHNTAIDLFRKRKSLVFSDLNLENEDTLENFSDIQLLPHELFETNENIQKVRSLIEKLDSPYREVLYLKYQEDLDMDEIAQVLNRPIDTVKSQHRRALIKIKKDISK